MQPLFPRLQRIKSRIQVEDRCAKGSGVEQNTSLLGGPPDQGDVLGGSGLHPVKNCSSWEHPNRFRSLYGGEDNLRGDATTGAEHEDPRGTVLGQFAGSDGGSSRITRAPPGSCSGLDGRLTHVETDNPAAVGCNLGAPPPQNDRLFETGSENTVNVDYTIA